MAGTLTDAEVTQLPAVIAGGRVRGGVRTRLTLPSGRVALVPELDAEALAQIRGIDRDLLRPVPLDEILSFLHQVGRNWRSREYARRLLFVRQLSTLVGFSVEEAETEADWIALYLSGHTLLADQLAAEIGNRHLVDRWVPSEDCELHAGPLGLVVHTVAGNVPMSGVLSIVRALLTKNVSVVKPSGRDPVTPVSLALSFLDVDPGHPVARAVSAIYWGRDNPAGKELIAQADGVCAWGGAQAIRAVHAQTSPEASFLPFGPRFSLALVGPGDGRDHILDAARRVAHDVSRYDQEACFSVQRVFVETSIAADFTRALTAALEEFTELLPPRARSTDHVARVSLTRLEEEVLGHEVVGAPEATWSVVVADPDGPEHHSLCRTVYVHPIEDPRAILSYVGPRTQTVALHPMERFTGLHDDLAARGVSRIVDAGLANVFRLGGAHDGFLPMQRLVRYISVEAPVATFGKGSLRTVDQVGLLRAGCRITDLLP
ncbi:aldehyde dehydrogenase family protein [Frankia sp. Cppng1_Ct_nod]|uniref:aldehyde dehydrogenase family protein n=1 Tax=Frankia sp. Cppng1_Ct_nod TaxID=2897162 RepID=UPI001041BA55|nr:aldehyde dehydrogenase family protein [Frankia sp. Cppng1_Ct_nod]